MAARVSPKIVVCNSPGNQTSLDVKRNSYLRENLESSSSSLESTCLSEIPTIVVDEHPGEQTSLDLSRSSHSKEDLLEILEHSSSIESISFGDNPVDKEHIEQLPNILKQLACENCTQLDLNTNGIFRRFCSLQILKIHDSTLPNLKFLKRMRCLTEISLNNTKSETEDPAFPPLPQVRTLSLKKCHWVTFDVLQSISAGLSDLRECYLSGEGITHEGIAVLIAMNHFEYLRITVWEKLDREKAQNLKIRRGIRIDYPEEAQPPQRTKSRGCCAIS